MPASLAGFFDITITMSQGFVLKEFILQTSPSFFREYCQLNNISITFPKSNDEDDVKEEILEQLASMSDKERSAIELDLQEINSLTPNEGLHMLIEEAKGKNLEVPFDEVEQLNQHDKAFWFYLHQNELFSEVATWYEVNDTRGWKELTGLKNIIDASKIKSKTGNLQKALSTYIFANELRGKNCYVECYEQEDRLCFVAYPEDYTESSIVYDRKKLRKRYPHKPVDKIFFLYYPKEGRLSTKAAGGWKRAKAIQKIFGEAVLGIELNVDSDRVFNLDRLKDPQFEFPTPPEDKVEFVKLKQLQLRFFGGTRRINLDVNEDTDGVQPIHDFIKDLRIHLNRVYVSKAVFQIKFDTPIKKSSGTLTFYVGWPNSHNINDNPRYRVVKQYLKDWGLEYQFEEILNSLFSFDITTEATTAELFRLFTAPVTHWATQNGVYKKSKALKEVQCKSCSGSHKVKSRNGTFFYFCPVTNSRDWVDVSELERWTLQSKGLLLLLSSKLELTGKVQENDKFWSLGNANILGQKVPVYYCSEKTALISLGISQPFYVVISPEEVSDDDENSAILINTHDLITLAKGEVVIDKELFEETILAKVQRVKFDEKNGDLWVDHQNVVLIKPGTPQYLFIMNLWENFNNPVGHEEIYDFYHSEMAKNQGVEPEQWKDEYTPQNFSNKMKSLIKKNATDEEAKKLIQKIIQVTKTVKGEPAYRLTNPR